MWNTRGLRGSTFEEMINLTNDRYRQKGLALIQKIPTSIVPVKFENNRVSDGYFLQQSTVDYIGVVQSLAVCFDAKETASKSLPLANVHEHQIAFMDAFQKQKGCAFLLVSFNAFNECYFLPFEVLKGFWDAKQAGERKSIPYSAFEKRYLVASKAGYLVHYLEPLSFYMSGKEN